LGDDAFCHWPLGCCPALYSGGECPLDRSRWAKPPCYNAPCSSCTRGFYDPHMQEPPQRRVRSQHLPAIGHKPCLWLVHLPITGDYRQYRKSQKSFGYCWRTYFHPRKPTFLHRHFHGHVPCAKPYARHDFRRSQVRQQYPFVL
jgi:hypothetical protein